MDKLLLLGDEAIAQGAIDGGMSGIYAYPGTPSTEITEYVQRSKAAKEKDIHSDWSANEKTARCIHLRTNRTQDSMDNLL